jgi:hypothetical protein
MNHALSPARIRQSSSSVATLLSVLSLSVAALWVAIIGLHDIGFNVFGELRARPEGPVLLLLRAVVFLLAVWIGGGTLLAVALKTMGLHRAANQVVRHLPALVRPTIGKALGIAIATSLLLQATAGAATIRGGGSGVATASSSQTANTYPANNSPVGTVPVIVNGSGGQRWPILPKREPALSDADDTPVLRVVGTAPLVTGKPSFPTPTIAVPSTLPVSTTSSTSIALTTVATIPPTSTPVAPLRSANLPAVSGVNTGQPAVRQRAIRQHRVVAGDHFWSIAEAELERLGRPTTDTHIARYSELVVAQNRSRLIDPNNADLLTIGMIIDLP